MRLYHPSPRFGLTTPAEQPAKPSAASAFPLRTSAETALRLLIHALELLGWKPGIPDHAIDPAKIDQKLVASAKCPNCRRKGRMAYHSWTRPWRGWLAVKLCTCGHVEEI